MPLNRLCSTGEIASTAADPGEDAVVDLSKCWDGAVSQPTSCACARASLAQKRVALLLDMTKQVREKLGGMPPEAPGGKAGKGKQSFYFRQPSPMTFRLVTVDEKEETEIGKPETKLALHPFAGLRGVSLDQKAMRKGTLALTFSSLGIPSSITVSSSSSAAAWAGALAEGTKGLRDEYKATVEALVDIQGKQRELNLKDLSDQLAKLKKEKEVLDARVSLDVIAGSEESLVAKQKLENELALVESQLKLSVAQDTLELRAQTQALAAELARVTQELDLVKKRLELAEAQRPK